MSLRNPRPRQAQEEMGSLMNDDKAIRVGDFAILREGHKRVIGPISKITERKVYHPDPWGGLHTSSSFKVNLIFTGGAKDCCLLSERITSSEALLAEDEARAHLRHQQRVATAITRTMVPKAPVSPFSGGGEG